MREFHRRIATSLGLFAIFYLSLLNNIILSFVLGLIVFILFIEFNNIFSKIFNKKNKLLNLIAHILVLLYLFYFLLCTLIFLNQEDTNNKNLLIFVISICILTDVGGYVFGNIFKGKKLTKISPKKTYSGVYGSFAFPLVASIIFFRNLDLLYNYILVVLIISFISQIGDLLISFLKRKAKIKDTGTLLPGHGGLLDRLDGILLALPLGINIVSL